MINEIETEVAQSVFEMERAKAALLNAYELVSYPHMQDSAERVQMLMGFTSAVHMIQSAGAHIARVVAKFERPVKP